MDDTYKNIQEYNRNKKRQVLMVFDNMIADMLCNKKLNPILTELFIRARKLNISLVFVSQSYVAVPEILNSNKILNHTKFYALCYYENSKQTRASANRI